MAARTQSRKTARKAPRAAKKATARRGTKTRKTRNGSSANGTPKLNGKASALQHIGLMMLAGRKDKALLARVADLLQQVCKYRWVGIYTVAHRNFVLAGSSNNNKPAYREFPVCQGISGEVYESRKTIIVRDVSKDKRFLPNFWTTKSEIIVPIIDDEHNEVTGVLNVESSRLNAFDKSDRDLLEGVGRLIWRALR